MNQREQQDELIQRAQAAAMNKNLKPATVTDCLRHYLATLEQIQLAKQDLKIIELEAEEMPGVERRTFKAIAQALHQAPGGIEEKLANMGDFIEMAFQNEEDA